MRLPLYATTLDAGHNSAVRLLECIWMLSIDCFRVGTLQNYDQRREWRNCYLCRCLSSPSQSFSSSIRDLYSLLDDNLKYKLAYAWSLPSNARFITKMKTIQDAANELSPATEFKSRIYYLIRNIRETVIVSTYLSLSIISIDNSV